MLSNSHYHSQADQGVAVVIFSQTPSLPLPNDSTDYFTKLQSSRYKVYRQINYIQIITERPS